ncbi:hypothetical protein AAKU55_001516 [Oxalobacteraceae bacterium GrIS 1.11]
MSKEATVKSAANGQGAPFPTSASIKAKAAAAPKVAAPKVAVTKVAVTKVAPRAAKPVAAANPALKPAAKPAAKASVKPAAKPVAKVAAKAAPLAMPDEAAKDKARKPKLVRDSFTMPEVEYAVLGQVKKACLKAGFEIKKSELLRIGVALISQIDLATLQSVLAALPQLKTGRPKKV